MKSEYRQCSWKNYFIHLEIDKKTYNITPADVFTTDNFWNDPSMHAGSAIALCHSSS